MGTRSGANGIAGICDELGDLQIRKKEIEARELELMERLREESRRTKETLFEGKRFDARVVFADMPYTRYKDAFELLAKRTHTTDDEQRKILKYYTKMHRDRSWAKIWIPKGSDPKKRIS